MAEQELSGQPTPPQERTAPLGYEHRMQLFFLSRIDHLISLRNHPDTQAPEIQRLVKWGLYTTYRDCLSVGVGDEARLRLGFENKPAQEAHPTLPESGTIAEFPKNPGQQPPSI